MIRTLDVALYLLLVAFCFFTFNHVDINHTIGCSFALLNGHFADFYDYNAAFFRELNYLPSTYVLFAVWGLPVKLLGLATPLAYPPWGVTLWFKVLTTLFFAGSAYVLALITSRLKPTGDSHLSATPWIWLTSPIAIFSQFIFGQYDILTVFFTLLGLLFWMDRKLWKFSLIFGVAITFKYFPLFLFLPLLFLVEKRPLRLLGYAIPFALPLVFEAGLYHSSPAFVHGVFGFKAAGRAAEALVTIGSTNFNLLYFILAAVTLTAFLMPTPKVSLAGFKTSLKLISLGCFAVFCCFLWHPQWVIFLTPLIALLIATSVKPSRVLWIDLILSVAFVAFTVRRYSHNVDQFLLAGGFWGYWVPRDWEKVHDMHQLFFFSFLKDNGWLAIFNAALFVILAGNHFRMGQSAASAEGGDGDRLGLQHASLDDSPSELLRIGRYRLYIGVAVFVLPAILVVLLTPR